MRMIEALGLIQYTVAACTLHIYLQYKIAGIRSTCIAYSYTLHPTCTYEL